MIYTTEKILEKMLLAINYGDKCRGLSCIVFLSEVEELLGKPVDAVSLRQIPYYLVEPIKKEGVLLYESNRQRDHDLERNYEILQRH